MASTRYVVAYCSLLGAVLLLCSVGCGSGKPMDGDGRLITKPGCYAVERLGFGIDVQVNGEGVYYTVTDRDGQQILASTRQFSAYQKWCLFWDANDCLWASSSDVGVVLWRRGEDGAYQQVGMRDQAALIAQMPEQVFDRLPTSIREEWRPLRAAGK